MLESEMWNNGFSLAHLNIRFLFALPLSGLGV